VPCRGVSETNCLFMTLSFAISKHIRRVSLFQLRTIDRLRRRKLLFSSFLQSLKLKPGFSRSWFTATRTWSFRLRRARAKRSSWSWQSYVFWSLAVTIRDSRLTSRSFIVRRPSICILCLLVWNSNVAFNAITVAPLKALCSEKFKEWSGKFERSLKLKCIELTGDTDQDEENVFHLVQNANIICTTPVSRVSFLDSSWHGSICVLLKEKWDIVTRKWKNSRAIIDSIKLFLIDEIHVLGESSRGAVIEAVISRMKTFASKRQRGQSTGQDQSTSIRFVAISATIPNIEDVWTSSTFLSYFFSLFDFFFFKFANWLGDASSAKAALYYKMNEKFRPVKLDKFVLGYYCSPKMSDYCFDLSLSYKLAQVVDTYSDSKPTLIVSIWLFLLDLRPCWMLNVESSFAQHGKALKKLPKYSPKPTFTSKAESTRTHWSMQVRGSTIRRSSSSFKCTALDITTLAWTRPIGIWSSLFFSAENYSSYVRTFSTITSWHLVF